MPASRPSQVAIEWDASHGHLHAIELALVEAALTERLGEDLVVHADGLVRAREGAVGDVGGVGSRGPKDRLAQAGVWPSMTGHERPESQQIGHDLDLAAATGPRA